MKDEIKDQPKVLIAAPIGGKKQYSINTWFKWIAIQTYQNFDFCLCANGKDRHKLLEKIRQVEIRTVYGNIMRPVAILMPNSGDLSMIQKVTYSRETIRRYAVKEGYEAIFWLDTDTIPANKDTIEILMKHDLDSVSGLYFYKESRVPVAIDNDTHTNFGMEKLEQAAESRIVLPCWGTGYGCLLHRRKAMAIPFDYDLFGEERTDDFGHCAALDKTGVNRYIDPYILCKHFGESSPVMKINDMIQIGEDSEPDHPDRINLS